LLEYTYDSKTNPSVVEQLVLLTGVPQRCSQRTHMTDTSTVSWRHPNQSICNSTT